LPNFYANISGIFEIPSSVIADPSAGTLAGVLTTGALKTGPDRDTATQLHNAQVFNNTTTSANGSTMSIAEARWLMVYLDMAESGNPTDIRMLAQFSHDGGSTWFNWAVDQWTDLRYVPAQLPLSECIPLNYVVGTLFRLRIVATGTTATDTFTVSAWAELVS
jgi:hypothetical protein